MQKTLYIKSKQMEYLYTLKNERSHWTECGGHWYFEQIAARRTLSWHGRTYI